MVKDLGGDVQSLFLGNTGIIVSIVSVCHEGDKWPETLLECRRSYARHSVSVPLWRLVTCLELVLAGGAMLGPLGRARGLEVREG